MKGLMCRGVCTKTDKLVYGWFVDYTADLSYIYGGRTGNAEIWQVTAETVGQFTGLYDNLRTEKYPEGQRIFERDLIKSECYDFGDKVWYTKVEEVKNTISYLYHLEQSLQSDLHRNFEVIGNIDENPTLLQFVMFNLKELEAIGNKDENQTLSKFAMLEPIELEVRV